MNINSGISNLLKGVQTPNPINVYDVYSPAKQQQFIINQQNIAANQQSAEQNQLKLQEAQRQQQQQLGLEEDLADYYDTVGYINTGDSDTEELNRTVYQNQLGLAEVYKQNGQPQKAIDLANNAISMRLELDKQEDREDRQALQDLIQAGHTRNQGIVDFTQKLHGDVYDKFGVGRVNVPTPSTGGAGTGGGNNERTLTSPDGTKYNEKELETIRKSLLKKAEKKEFKDEESFTGNKYAAPISVYDPKKFAALVKEYGIEGANRQIMNPPGNNPIGNIGEAAGRNVVIIRKKQ